MSRRNAAKKREIIPDVKYNSTLLAKFINVVMEQGKKELARNIVYGAFQLINTKYSLDGFEVFNKAIDNVKPSLEVTSVRVGGGNYQVPAPVGKARGETLAIRWIIKSSQKRSERSMIEKLGEELYDAANSKGSSVKQREDTHKMAEANRAFAHLSPKAKR